MKIRYYGCLAPQYQGEGVLSDQTTESGRVALAGLDVEFPSHTSHLLQPPYWRFAGVKYNKKQSLAPV